MQTREPGRVGSRKFSCAHEEAFVPYRTASTRALVSARTAFSLRLLMNFGVCIKQVPDVAAPVQVRDGFLSFDTGRMVLNAYDASSVEEALVLTSEHGGAVEVILMGPSKAAETIRKAIAMGAGSGVHIVAEDEPEDALVASAILADALEGRGYDVIAFGKQAQDTDAGLVGAMVAERLGLPYAANAVGLAIEGDTLVVTRQGDKGQETISLPTPCVVTCSNDMNDPRIPNLKGIMQAKRKPIDTVQASDYGSSAAPAVTVTGHRDVPAREAGDVLEGAPEELVGALVERLDAANVL